MLSLSLIFAVIIILSMIFELSLPDFWRRNQLFSVTVSPESRSGPEAKTLIRRWCITNVVLGLVAAAISAVTTLLPQSSYLIIPPLVVVLYNIAVAALYVDSHRQAKTFALPSSGNVTSEFSDPPRFYGELIPFWWELLPLAIIALTALVLASRYPNAPAIIPIHFNLAGQADGFATKSIASFYSLVWTQLGIWLLFTTVVILGVAYTAKDGSYRRLQARRLFGIKTGIMVLLSFTALFTTTAYQSGTGAGELAALAFAFNIAVIGLAIYLFVRSGQGGQQPKLGSAGMVESDGTPDSAWVGGLFYYNPDDPAIFVEKRFGLGFTLNFGQPVSWLFLVGLLLIPIIVATAAGR